MKGKCEQCRYLFMLSRVKILAHAARYINRNTFCDDTANSCHLYCQQPVLPYARFFRLTFQRHEILAWLLDPKASANTWILSECIIPPAPEGRAIDLSLGLRSWDRCVGDKCGTRMISSMPSCFGIYTSFFQPSQCTSAAKKPATRSLQAN